MSIVMRVLCDDCTRIAKVHFNQDGTDARKRLAKEGWTHNGLHDYCPDCAKRRAAEKEEGLDIRG